MDKINVALTDELLDLNSVMASVTSAEAGGINVFVGTVRNNTKDKPVVRLEYEAYDRMAVKEMRKLAEEVCDRWPVARISIHHRKGTLHIGQAAVIIAVACPHRKEAFEACKYTIDTLKERVTIWKKEIFEDGEEWVFSHA
jgi:molybdopterin synthase catalytic subunit